MKLTRLDTPGLAQTAPTTNNTEARERAIKMLTQAPATQNESPQAQETPVQNPNQVSPEEMSAIKAPTPKVQETVENIDKNTEVEATSPTEEPKDNKQLIKDPETERRFAELARQERVIRAKAQKQAQDLQTREDALKAREDALNVKSKDYETGYISKDKLKIDPLQALADAELSYDELTQRLLNQQPRDPRVEARMDRLEAENKALRSKIEEGVVGQQQAQDAAYKAAIRQIENDTIGLINSDPVAYEVIAKTNNAKAVVKLIEDTFNKDGIVLTVEEAAEEVENHLLEQDLERFSKIEKYKKRLAQPAASTVAATPITETQAKQQTQTQMKTLTNATASTRKLSARERALLAFKGELKG